MEENENESFKKELEKISSDEVFSHQYKRKKIIIWFIRTVIAFGLYYYFWEYNWVKWSLILYVPLNLFGLIMILGGSYFLNKKLKRIQEQNEL